jgi:DNA-binding MarR family transcriptional regulator
LLAERKLSFLHMPATTTTVEEVVRSLYRLGIVHRELARHALAELGSQGFTALAAVHKHGPIRISDVAQRLNIDLSVASRQVAALEAAGYIRREADEADRRATRLTATDAGARVLEESHRRMVAAFAAALSGWTDDEVAGLAHGLERLRDDVARTAGDPPQEDRRR